MIVATQEIPFKLIVVSPSRALVLMEGYPV